MLGEKFLIKLFLKRRIKIKIYETFFNNLKRVKGKEAGQISHPNEEPSFWMKNKIIFHRNACASMVELWWARVSLLTY